MTSPALIPSAATPPAPFAAMRGSPSLSPSERRFRGLLCVAFLLQLGAFLWLYTGGQYQLDAAQSAGARYFSLARYAMLMTLGGYIVLTLHRGADFRALIRENAAAYAIVALMFVSVAWSAYPWDSIRGATQLLLASLIATTVFLESPTALGLARLRSMAVCFIVLSALFSAAFPHLATIAGGYGDVYKGALRGILSDKNPFGNALSSCMVILVLTVRIGPGSWVRSPYTACILAGLVMLVLSQSATSMIAFLLPTMLLMANRTVLAQTPNAGLRLLLVVMASLLAGFVAFVGPTLLAEMSGSVGRDATLTGRTEIWELTWNAGLQRPLLGYGYLSFWQDYIGENGLLARLGMWEIAEAHNGFIEVLLSTGFVGLTLVVVVMLYLLVRSFTGMILRPSNGNAEAALLLVLNIVLENFTESVYLAPNYAATTIIAVACILAHRRDYSTGPT
ncbi:O-antigen ligase family protein [Sphingomonas sanguinis]|uniref:O-antigen ligase-related domain-containing protein n=1 Tax=Sphingomonas sanguinis TaxID=33051 RepID=A0A147IPW4_9SPHN|nr:O-antigen ligase family protein [Sphingomonas sanguinis]KTT97315.1 hypothetical protein SB4_13580 [Sphingomonas sanguinis]